MRQENYFEQMEAGSMVVEQHDVQGRQSMASAVHNAPDDNEPQLVVFADNRAMHDADHALIRLQAMPDEVIQRVLEFADLGIACRCRAIAIPTLIMRLLGGIVGHDAADYVQCLEFDDQKQCLTWAPQRFNRKQGRAAGYQLGALDGAFFAVKLSGRHLVRMLCRRLQGKKRMIWNALGSVGVEVVGAVLLAQAVHGSGILSQSGFSALQMTRISLKAQLADITSAILGAAGREIEHGPWELAISIPIAQMGLTFGSYYIGAQSWQSALNPYKLSSVYGGVNVRIARNYGALHFACYFVARMITTQLSAESSRRNFATDIRRALQD